MSDWEPIVFFAGEDPEAIKAEFVRLCAKHKNNFTAFEVAKHVFKGRKEPEIRALQAADAWGKDLEVQEAIRTLVVNGDNCKEDIAPSELKNLALQIAMDTKVDEKNRLAAIRLIAEMQGNIVKPIEFKNSGGGQSVMPMFQIMAYPDLENEAA